MSPPWLDEMRRSEQESEYDANTPNNDVCDSQKRILASHHGPGGDDNGLGASIFGGGKICLDISA